MFFCFQDKSRLIKSFGNCNKALVIRWSVCQSTTITEQLNGGVRYFDMRPGYIDYEDDFYFVHGLHGILIREMLIEMRHFLDENPQEIIIVDFNHFHCFDKRTHARFVQLIWNIFGNLLFSRDVVKDADISSLTLFDMRSCSKQVLLSYKDREICSENSAFWFSKDLIFSPWYNTNDLSYLEHRLSNLIMTQSNGKLNIFQGILTARKTTVLSNPNSTLREALVIKCNTGLKKWLHHLLDERKQQHQQQQQRDMINIMMCDFVVEDGLVELILKFNNIK